MIRPAALLTLLAALMPAPPLRGQVLRVAAAASSNTGEASGAALSLYRQDETTTLGAGLQQGLHLGGRRQVSAGKATLALGDSALELPLPSDMENTPRSFLARGLLLQNSAGGTSMFAGFTGATTANSIASSVLPSKFVGVLSSTASLGPCDVTTLVTRGVRSNTLISLSHARAQSLRIAMTAGRSGSSNILRTLVATQGASYRLAISENLGIFQLQPTVASQAASLERIGLNVIASRSFGRHWTLDGARHSYSTASVSHNSIYQGVTAPRSQLLEAGAMLHLGSLQVQGRVLNAASGAQRSNGSIATAAWTAQRWSLQATVLASRVSNPAGTGPPNDTRSADLQAAHQVSARLRLEAGSTLGGTSNAVNLGGSWTGDRFGLSVAHHQMFVPFGMHSGFHSAVVVSARVRLGGSEATTSVTRGGGMPTTVWIGTDGYYGAVQDTSIPESRPARLPRFSVQGHVRDAAGEPIRGAAVRIAATVVYTDSEGLFLARFDKERPLTVRLLPEQFLAAQNYRDVSGEVSVRPTRDGGNVLLLAERCNACGAGATDGQTPVRQETEVAGTPRRSAIARAARQMRLLAIRMFTGRSARNAFASA